MVLGAELASTKSSLQEKGSKWEQVLSAHEYVLRESMQPVCEHYGCGLRNFDTPCIT